MRNAARNGATVVALEDESKTYSRLRTSIGNVNEILEATARIVIELLGSKTGICG